MHTLAIVKPDAVEAGKAGVILAHLEGAGFKLRAARLVLLNKMDLAPHVDFSVAAFREYALRVNPELEILELSARSGAGLRAWYDWVRARRAAPHP